MHAGNVKDRVEVNLVESGDPYRLEVTVEGGGSRTEHSVTLGHDTFQRLTGGQGTPERCVEVAFRFLLDREPKEAILSRFDVTVISRYFPEFESRFETYYGS